MHAHIHTHNLHARKMSFILLFCSPVILCGFSFFFVTAFGSLSHFLFQCFYSRYALLLLSHVSPVTFYFSICFFFSIGIISYLLFEHCLILCSCSSSFILVARGIFSLKTTVEFQFHLMTVLKGKFYFNKNACCQRALTKLLVFIKLISSI